MRIRFGDIIVAVLVAAAAVILIFTARPAAGERASAVVLRDGAEVFRVDLQDGMEDQTYTIEELGIVIEFEDGRARFVSSSCLDQTCVHTGWIERAGDIAVCLPNGVVLKIEGGAQSDIDVVAE